MKKSKKCINYKEVIINELTIILKKEKILKNFFKYKAYEKVIKQIELKSNICNINDLDDIIGIGISIKTKLEEIFKNGKLNITEKIKETMKLDIYDKLLQIHGIGIIKAKQLIEKDKITDLSDLKKKLKDNPKLLNSQQTIGLKYLKDLQERIPRNEMDKHNSFLKKIFKKSDIDIEFNIVGSYRRKEDTSGDIDVLINSSNFKIMDNIIKYMGNYIIANLSKGIKKYMGIVSLPDGKKRRLDILITKKEEYPFAKLYFTGNFQNNINLRLAASKLGYKLNEYSLINIKKNKKIKLNSEKEIYEFLGFKYIKPKTRNGNLISLKI